MRSCPRTYHQPSYGHLAFEANWKGEKAWCIYHASWADQKSKQAFLKWHLLLHNNNEAFLNWIVICDKKWTFLWWLTMISSAVGQRRSSKALSKTKLRPKKVHGLLLVSSTTAFWIPVKSLHLRSMLSKLMKCMKNYNACNWYWSTENIQFFSMATPDGMLHNQSFKSWTN